MDPESTGPEGAHALIALLRDHGVTVVVANNVDDAANAARPGTLLLFAQTQRVSTEGLLNRLADAPGDLLLVEPTSHARAALAPVSAAAAPVPRTPSRIALCEKRIRQGRWTSGRRTRSAPSAIKP